MNQPRDLHDPEPYEWEDAQTATCAGCSIVRPLKSGICRQCTRERAEAPISARSAERASIYDLEAVGKRRALQAREYREGNLW